MVSVRRGTPFVLLLANRPFAALWCGQAISTTLSMVTVLPSIALGGWLGDQLDLRWLFLGDALVQLAIGGVLLLNAQLRRFAVTHERDTPSGASQSSSTPYYFSSVAEARLLMGHRANSDGVHGRGGR